MLNFVRSPLTRSFAALAIMGGVGIWNYISTAHGTCYGRCFLSEHVDVWYRTPCVGGHRVICGEFSLVSYPDGAHNCVSKRVPTKITWVGACPVSSLCVARGGFRPTVCVAFYDPVGRCCPCAGCGVAHCNAFCHLSNAASYCLPTTCPLYWIQTCHGLCMSAG
jgi:hypothetical protein